MRRKKGTLIAVEQEILSAALSLRRQGVDEFHGFGLAREIQDLTRTHRLRAHSTLYRALRRLEELGYLRSRWEDPVVAAKDNRLRRRLYRLIASEATLFAKLDHPGTVFGSAWEAPI